MRGRRLTCAVSGILVGAGLVATACGGSSASGTPPGGTVGAHSSSRSDPAATASPAAAAVAAVTAAPVRVAETSDGAVGYRSVGNGPTIVLIMGFAGTLDDWTPSFVAQLARSHRVVTFDNAGIGRTAALPRPQTVTTMAQQTAALITALHLGRTDVLGWSLGGMIAQALAVEHPKLVDHLLLAATLPGNGAATEPTAAASRQLAASLTNPALVLSLLFPPGSGAAGTAYVSGIASWPDRHAAPPTALAGEESALGSWLGGTEPVGRRIGSITAPTLVGDGSEDLLAPPPNATALTSAIHGAQVAIYPGAGHAFLFQDQEPFLARVAAFLG